MASQWWQLPGNCWERQLKSPDHSKSGTGQAGQADRNFTPARMVSGFGKYDTDSHGGALASISYSEILDLVKSPARGVAKDAAQWCIPSTYMHRKGQKEHGRFAMLWADVDAPAHTIAETAAIVGGLVEGHDFAVYASRSATAEKQKCRVLVPLATELPPHQWLIASSLFREKLHAAGIETDPASERPSQVLYLPNEGEFYDAASASTGEALQPLLVWTNEFQEFERQAREVQLARKAAQKARAALKSARTTQVFKSLIDAFNAAYDVADILLHYGYKQRGNAFMHPNSKTGSYSATVKDGRVHSLSTNDPLNNGAGAHDAFSAFEVLAHGGNRDAALKDAGDNWLAIGGESWNTVRQREWAQAQSANAGAAPRAGADTDPETGEILANTAGAFRPVSQHGQGGGAGFEPLHEDDTDQKNARPSFKFVPIGSLLKSPQPVSFLVDELIEHPSLGLVFGPHSCGKSFVTLSMAACVATGTPWMERDVTPGAVFYLAGEGHAGIARRLMGWSAHSGVSLDGAPLFVSEVPAKLMDAQAAADVILAIEAMTSEFGRPALIVIDTFHRNMGGGDENSNSDIGIFISHIDGMRARTGATVLLVHHSGHNPESQDRGRGASAMGAAMDCILQVSKEDDAITLISRKTKESETPPPLRLELRHPVALPADWIDAKCRPMTTAVAVLSHAPAPAKTKRLTPAQQLALTTYRESACEAGEWNAEAETVRVHLDDWRKVFYEKSTADSPDAKRTAFNTARKELVGRGLLSVMNDFYAMKASDSILQAAKFAHEMTKKDSEAPKRSEANRSTS